MNYDILTYFRLNTPPEIENVMMRVANSFISKGINTMNQLCDAPLDNLTEMPNVTEETIELILLLCEKYMAEHDSDAKGCDSS